ncbi:MAG: hypothetical protein K0S22_580 [Oscillospiraceae bacterium]|jgi:hypothetical protein|nr:hypothetical protein [Oscillospiraceae bacterium]
MMKNKKKIRIAFWIIVLSGSALLGFITEALKISNSTRNVLLIIWLGVIAIVSVAIDMLWLQAFNRQLKSLQPILLKEHDPDRYIQEISALLEGKKSPHLRCALLINLSAAYCEKKEYDTAKTLLMQINPKKITGINKLIFWANLAYIHFYLNENEQACTILTQQQKEFSKFAEHPHLGGLIAILSVFKKLSEGETSEANTLLEKVRARWENEQNAPDFDYLMQRCS